MTKQARGGLVQRVAAVGGLVATLSFSSGCPNSSIGPIDHDRLAGAVGGMAAGYKSQTTTGKKSAAYGELSGMLIRESQMHGEVRAAREGKSEQNVYVMQNEFDSPSPSREPNYDKILTANHPELGQVVMLSCEFFVDEDKDLRIDLDEFKNIKRTSRTDEQIVLFMRTSNPGNGFGIELRNGYGETAASGSKKEQMLKEKLYGDMYRTNGTFVLFERGALRGGDYTASFSYNGEPLGELKINVIED